MTDRGSAVAVRAEAIQKARLEGPGMSGPLAAAIRPLGMVLLGWKHLRSHHRPGAGVSALYRVQAVPRSGSRGVLQQPVHLQVGATTAVLTAVQRVPTVRGAVDNTLLRLWVHPRDPVLSGLSWATSAGAVTRDLFGSGPREAQASLDVVVYRPLRRAVIRAVCGGATAYLKVPQPHLVAGLRRRLEIAAAAGLPVPPLLPVASTAGPAADTVLALGALPGVSLHRLLAAEPGAQLDPGVLIELLDGLPVTALALPRKPAWADRVLDYAAGAAVACPEMTDRIARCARETDAAVRSSDSGPLIATHGDFHGGNVLSASGRGNVRLSGLLDVDALGPGHRVDDLACFLGHLFVFAALNSRDDGLRKTAERCALIFAGNAGPAALYSRSAAVALTLVAGASSRGQQDAGRVLDAAEMLLARSRT